MGSTQTDEEAGHNKTGKHLAGGMVNHVKKSFQRRAINEWAREQRGVFSIRDDDPDYEEIMNKCHRKTGERENLSDALQSHDTSQSWRRPSASGLV